MRCCAPGIAAPGWRSARASRTPTRHAWTRCAGRRTCRWRAWSSRSADARCGGRTGRCRSTAWSRRSSLPVVRFVSRLQPLKEEVQAVRRFDAGVDRLWERVKGVACARGAPRFALPELEVHRAAARPLQVAVLRRNDEVAGYVVYRHLREPQGRVTQIVDLLADPRTSGRSRRSRAGWIARRAWRIPTRSAAMSRMPSSAACCAVRGISCVKSDINVIVKVNAVTCRKDFYQSGDQWHLTLGRRRDGPLDQTGTHVTRTTTERRHRRRDEGQGHGRGSGRSACSRPRSPTRASRRGARWKRRRAAGRVHAGQAAARFDRAVHRRQPPGAGGEGAGGDRGARNPAAARASTTRLPRRWSRR